MTPALSRIPDTPHGYSDGFGDRSLVADRSNGDTLELLRLRPGLTAAPSFEFALRERTARLANFRHAAFARVRRVDRRPEAGGGLVIVSEHVEGARLAEILQANERDHLALNINAALCLVRQLVPAVALLHENARDVAHGAIAPERLVVTRHARLVVVEHVMGAAVEQLQYGRDRFWRELRVAMPPAAGMLRCDQRTDVTQIGVVALALIAGRALGADEFPHQVPRLLDEATELSVLGDRQPLSPALKHWLQRTLQLDLRRSFATAREACQALERTLSDEPGYVAAPVALETFLAAYHAGARGHASDADDGEGAPRSARPRAAAEAPAASADLMELRNAGAPDVSVPAPLHSPEPSPLFAAFGNAGTPAARGPDARPDIADLVAAQPPSPPPPARRALGRHWRRAVIVVLALVAFAQGAMFAARAYWRTSPTPARPGALVVDSAPPGIDVFVDGLARGRTPARLPLDPGAHILELRGRGLPRVIPVTIEAGAHVSQYFELRDEAAPESARLEIRSEPAGARVSVDGQPRGVTPLALEDVPPGEHHIVLDAGQDPVQQTVVLRAGDTASVVVPMAPASSGPASGWIAVSAPFVMTIFEDGRLLGTTETDRIMVPAGRHVLEIVNETLGYRGTHPVAVTPGRVASLPVELPAGTMHLNATPWAEVWVDGQRLGETPLGNLAVSIGAHEVVFRHPEHGEKRVAVTVTLAAPARVSVDMTGR